MEDMKKEIEQYVTGETLIGDLVREHPEAIGVLLQIGMHCIGCPSSAMESVEEAAYVHGYTPESVVAVINFQIAQAEAEKAFAAAAAETMAAEDASEAK